MADTWTLGTGRAQTGWAPDIMPDARSDEATLLAVSSYALDVDQGSVEDAPKRKRAKVCATHQQHSPCYLRQSRQLSAANEQSWKTSKDPEFRAFKAAARVRTPLGTPGQTSPDQALYDHQPTSISSMSATTKHVRSALRMRDVDRSS
jgi:hypothetical protein